MDLKGRNFLKLLDYTPEEMTYLLDLAAELKAKKKKGIPVDTLRGKTIEEAKEIIKTFIEMIKREITDDAELEKLCTDSVELIHYARNAIVKHVNIVQIMTYY